METMLLQSGEVLAFDPVEHRYTIDDKPVDGISALMQRFRLTDPPGDFAIPYMERGTRVHAATQQDDEGTFDDESAWAKSEEMGYLAAWRTLKREHPEYDHAPYIEHLCGSASLRFATKIDRVYNRSGVPEIVNLKTGEPYKHHPVQLAFEGFAFRGDTSQVFRRTGIYLAQDGSYKIKSYDDDQDGLATARAFAEANRMGHAWRVTRKARAKKVETADK